MHMVPSPIYRLGLQQLRGLQWRMVDERFILHCFALGTKFARFLFEMFELAGV